MKNRWWILHLEVRPVPGIISREATSEESPGLNTAAHQGTLTPEQVFDKLYLEKDEKNKNFILLNFCLKH